MILTNKAAKKAGFTHNGSYYGIPIFIGRIQGDLTISGKLSLLDPIIDILIKTDVFFCQLVNPGADITFQFVEKEKIT